MIRVKDNLPDQNFHKLLLFLIIMLLLAGCGSSLPTAEERDTRKINTGPGPEDIVLDTFAGQERLLISCTNRRSAAKPEGGIYAYNFQGNEAQELERKGEPKNLTFRPHGIDLVKQEDGKVYLYGISHPSKDDEQIHKIVKYLVKSDGLIFQKVLTNPELLPSPNDLSVLPDGSMYITNDYGLHTGFGRFWEMLFAMRTAFVVHYDGKDSWDIAVDRICFGNGILAKQDTLYVATTRKDGLLAFARKSDGTVHKRTQIVDLKGMDNLTQTPGGAILTAAHPNFIAFKKHAGNPENLSPGIVYRIDPDARNAEPVYASDGEEISGNSTALYYKGHLYIGQVFEGYILQCSTPELQ